MVPLLDITSLLLVPRSAIGAYTEGGLKHKKELTGRVNTAFIRRSPEHAGLTRVAVELAVAGGIPKPDLVGWV